MTPMPDLLKSLVTHYIALNKKPNNLNKKALCEYHTGLFLYLDYSHTETKPNLDTQRII